MKRIKVGIYVRELTYARRLMEVINMRTQLGMEAEIFSEEEKLSLFLETGELDILLLHEEAWKSEYECEAVGQVVLLSEGDVDSSHACRNAVYKYQSSEKIIRELVSIYSKSISREKVSVSPKSILYGIYSPVRYIDSNAFAIALVRELSKRSATLYISLQIFSELRQLFGTDYQGSIMDLIYYVNHREEGFAPMLGSIKKRIQGFDIICPADSPLDLQDVTPELWRKLITLLQTQSGHEHVILHVEEGIQEFLQLLECCDKVFVPIPEQTETSEQQEWNAFISRVGMKELTDKIIWVRLSEQNPTKRSTPILERAAAMQACLEGMPGIQREAFS